MKELWWFVSFMEFLYYIFVKCLSIMLFRILLNPFNVWMIYSDVPSFLILVNCNFPGFFFTSFSRHKFSCFKYFFFSNRGVYNYKFSSKHSFNCIPQIICCVLTLFHNIFSFLLWFFPLIHGIFRTVFPNIWIFLAIFLIYYFMIREHTLCDFNKP